MPSMPHYYIAHLLPDGTTEYLNTGGEFKNELVAGGLYGRTDETIVVADADIALCLAAEHDALVLVTTDDSGFKPI